MGWRLGRYWLPCSTCKAFIMIDLMTRRHLVGPEDILERLHEPGSVISVQSGEGNATVSEHVDVVLVTQACHGVLGQARVAKHASLFDDMVPCTLDVGII